MEPNKCYEWKWIDIHNIPKPYFIPLHNYLKKNYIYKKNIIKISF